MGPLPPTASGKTHIVVFQDLFTRYIGVAALNASNATQVTDAYKTLIQNWWGTVENWLSGNENELKICTIANLCRYAGIEKQTSVPYAPYQDPVERVNKCLKRTLRIFIRHNHKTWDTHLGEFCFAYNTSLHSSLGTLPAFLNFRRNPLAVQSLRSKTDSI